MPNQPLPNQLAWDLREVRVDLVRPQGGEDLRDPNFPDFASAGPSFGHE